MEFDKYINRLNKNKKEFTPKPVSDYEFKFGKHKGKLIKDVYRDDPEYIAWYLSLHKEELVKYMMSPLSFTETNDNYFVTRLFEYVREEINSELDGPQ